MSAVDEDDEVLPLGDFFTCKDYEPRTFVFSAPGALVVAVDEVSGSSSASTDVSVTLDALAAASTDFDLTGQIIWTCSIVTSWYIAHLARRDVIDEDVLELGAGCGLCGLTAALWARSVWLTDFEPEVLSLMERNAARVRVARVAKLSWGDATDHVALEVSAGRVTWRVIVGADVIYWSHAVPLLFDTVARLLARDGGVFICGFTDRVNGLRDATEAAASAVGLKWTCVALDTFLPNPLPTLLGPHTSKVTLYRFVWA